MRGTHGCWVPWGPVTVAIGSGWKPGLLIAVEASWSIVFPRKPTSYFSLLSTKEMLTRIYILRLFKKGVFTCLKVRLREKEIFHLLFYYPNDWNRHKKARSFTGSHTWVQRPDMWLLFHCFSQTMSRKLDHKWQDQQVNQCPYRMLALQVAALHTMPNCHTNIIRIQPKFH